jgi:dienelactone hydrolase
MTSSGTGNDNRYPAPLQAAFFNYFPDYRWSSGLLMALGSAVYGGADVGEVHHVGRSLAESLGDDAAWFVAWRAMGERLGAVAEDHASAGRQLTAAATYLRASSYLQIGERFVTDKNEDSLAVYADSVSYFQRFAELTDRPVIERVEVPYEGGATLPAYFVHPATRPLEPGPCLVFFDGLDITKELQYLRGVEELSRRGISCLIVDGPGNGETIRFRGLPLRYDYNVAGTAALDYLETRTDVDPRRIAVMGISLGGYYAIRCAAFEPRFAAVIAWGAIWDYHARWKGRLAATKDIPMSVPLRHIAWALGVANTDDALQVLEDWRLEGVAKNIVAPALIVHGGHDQQVPMSDATAVLDELSSEDKTLLEFPAGEPGAEHCQLDSPAPAMQAIADWLTSRLAS